MSEYREWTPRDHLEIVLERIPERYTWTHDSDEIRDMEGPVAQIHTVEIHDTTDGSQVFTETCAKTRVVAKLLGWLGGIEA